MISRTSLTPKLLKNKLLKKEQNRCIFPFQKRGQHKTVIFFTETIFQKVINWMHSPFYVTWFNLEKIKVLAVAHWGCTHEIYILIQLCDKSFSKSTYTSSSDCEINLLALKHTLTFQWVTSQWLRPPFMYNRGFKQKMTSQLSSPLLLLRHLDSDNIRIYFISRDDPSLVHAGGRLPELLWERAERRRHQQGGRHPGC